MNNTDRSDQSKYGNLKDLDKYDYIGTYEIPNTYTANLPENSRKTKVRPDSTRRIAHVNPNCNWS